MLLSLILLSVKCVEKTKPLPWNPTMDDNTIYVLTKEVVEIKKHVETFEQLRAKGQVKKANDELKLAKQSIDALEFFYIPLLNARAHVCASNRQYQLKDFTTAEAELKKARSQITVMRNKVTGKPSSDLNDLTSSLETLEKEIQSRTKITQDRFIQAVGQIDKLTGKTKSQQGG